MWSIVFAVPYLVSLKTPAIAKGSSPFQVQTAQQDLLIELQNSGIRATVSESTSYLSNVLLLDIDERDIQKMKSLKGIDTVLKSKTFPRPTVQQHPQYGHHSNPMINDAHDLTGVYTVREQYNLTGASVRVGIIDTGIDYSHSAFAKNGRNCVGQGCRVVYSYDFTGQNKPNDCMDTAGGHGTHVAGIVGGFNQDMTGVAPEVIFGGYKVFGAQSGASDFHIIQALDQAAKDKMQVINLSLGSPSGWDHNILTDAVQTAVDHKIIVAIANGNDGTSGLFLTDNPAIAKNSIAVASMDNKPAITMKDLNVTRGEEVVQLEYQVALVEGDSSVPTFRIKMLDMCSVSKVDVEFVAAVLTSECSMEDMIKNAMTMKVFLLLIHDQVYMKETSDIRHPVLYMNMENGQKLMDLLGEEEGLTSFGDNKSMMRIEEGAGKPSFFSSWGYGSELQMKPEIGAPGHLIFSSIPTSECNGEDCYAVWSGTSMATPYIAGVAALYLERYPLSTPEQFKMALMTSAVPYGFESVAQQGSGMVNVMQLIHQTLQVSPYKLELKADRKKTFTVTLESPESVDLSCSVIQSVAVAEEEEEIVSVASTDKVSVPERIQLKANTPYKMKVTIQPDADLPDKYLYSGYVACQGPSTYLVLPYGGFKGDYQGMEPIPEKDPEFPLPAMLKNRYSRTLLSEPEQSFKTSFTGNDIPILLVKFTHPVEALQIQLMKGGRAIGLVAYETHIGRNTEHYPYTPFFLVAYKENDDLCIGCVTMDKTMTEWSEIPDGEYSLRLTVQKAMGKIKKKAHYVTWDSPKMIVKRGKGRKSAKVNIERQMMELVQSW